HGNVAGHALERGALRRGRREPGKQQGAGRCRSHDDDRAGWPDDGDVHRDEGVANRSRCRDHRVLGQFDDDPLHRDVQPGLGAARGVHAVAGIMTRRRCTLFGALVKLSVVALVAPGCSDGRFDVDARPIERTRAAVHKGGQGTPIRHSFIGAYDPSLGDWYINMQRPGWSTDTGTSLAFRFGNPGDRPLVGDWNGDGVETQGVFRSGSWHLSNTLGQGGTDISFGYGNPSDLPIVGDWNGDGIATPGVFRDGTFLLRNSNATGVADVSFAFGSPGDIPLAGDWNGDGYDTVGVYRPSTSTFILTNDPTGQTIDLSQPFGAPGDLPVVGDWDGDGQTTQGITTNGTSFFLGNDLHSGFADLYTSFGASAFKPISGTWTANPSTNY